MAEKSVGVVINGATGRMGSTQHLRHLLDIRAEGGLPLANGDRIVPHPVIVGRDAARIAALSETHGGVPWSADIDAVLADPRRSNAAPDTGQMIFMDCAATGGRPALIRRAIAAGLHIHVEKPTAPTTAEALDLAARANATGVKHGVIQDKLYLPGFARMMALKRAGFFGRILAVRIEAGSWIFDGETQPCQRPSWNYRAADGGGLALDMMAHWRYMLDRLAAPVIRVASQLGTAIPQRIDEQGARYDVDVEDTVHALLTLEGGIMATVSNSWASRVRREDTMAVQIDGTLGSAVAGRTRCFAQSAADTPEAFFGIASGAVDPMAGWTEIEDDVPTTNPYRQCWELFLRHVGDGSPYVPTLLEGAKAVQLAELVYRSHAEGRWLDVPALAPAQT